MLANACFFLWFIFLSQSRGFLNRPCHGGLIGMPCDDITSSLERYKILSIISTAVYIREWCLRLMMYFIYFSVLDSVNTCWFLKIRFFFWNCVFWYRIFALKLYSHYRMSYFLIICFPHIHHLFKWNELWGGFWICWASDNEWSFKISLDMEENFRHRIKLFISNFRFFSHNSEFISCSSEISQNYEILNITRQKSELWDINSQLQEQSHNNDI